MGLDMYLHGEKFFWGANGNCPKEDGFDLRSRTLKLGYWRKHPDLHGYIVNTFAGGKDECQSIELSEKDIQKVIAAIEKEELPHTEGFFFGASQPEYKQKSLDIFNRALEWMRTKEKDVSRTIEYRASW